MITLPYILQVQACIALFWIVYRLCMRGSGAFRHNRIYLLASMPLAFLIPALSIPVWPAPELQPVTGVFDIGALEAFIVPAEETATIGWQEIAGRIYLAGALAMLCGAAWHLLNMRRSLRRSRVVQMNNVKIVSHETVRSPYSFFRYIFVNPEPDESKELPQIVAHEMAHVRLGHSYDSVFAQLVLILFWWNPFVWLWNRSLKEVHEYQADAAVLKLGFDSKQYITLLIGTLAGIHPEFVSGFSYSLLKNRLLMMTKKQNSRLAGFRILAAVPTLALLVLIFSCTNKLPEFPEENSQPTESAVTRTPLDDDEPFIRVEKMPTFQGGTELNFRNWALEQVRYPLVAAENGIQGRVIVQFIVEKNGTLSTVEILDSPDRALSEETIRVISSSPKWTPGTQRDQAVRVRFVLPIDFRLGSPAETSTEPVSPVYVNDERIDENPLMLVDGKEITGAEMSRLDPTAIASMEVLKDGSARQTYGEAARNGVILVTTKRGSNPFLSTPSPGNTLNDVVVAGYGVQRRESVTETVGQALSKSTPSPGNTLDDVVVIGYGVQRKESVAETIGQSLSESPINQIFVNGSRSGTEAGISVRGRITNGKPLIILDGQKMEENFDISNIDISKVESISVLKDESETQVYGEEGKDGVILIKTKTQ